MISWKFCPFLKRKDKWILGRGDGIVGGAGRKRGRGNFGWYAIYERRINN